MILEGVFDLANDTVVYYVMSGEPEVPATDTTIYLQSYVLNCTFSKNSEIILWDVSSNIGKTHCDQDNFPT